MITYKFLFTSRASGRPPASGEKLRRSDNSPANGVRVPSSPTNGILKRPASRFFHSLAHSVRVPPRRSPTNGILNRPAGHLLFHCSTNGLLISSRISPANRELFTLSPANGLLFIVYMAEYDDRKIFCDDDDTDDKSSGDIAGWKAVFTDNNVTTQSVRLNVNQKAWQRQQQAVHSNINGLHHYNNPGYVGSEESDGDRTKPDRQWSSDLRSAVNI